MKEYFRSTPLGNQPADEQKLFTHAINELCQNSEGNILGIEIGVLNGATSRYLLNINEKVELVGIDPVIPDSMEQSLIGSLEKIRQNTQEFGDRFEFVHDFSYNVAGRYSEGLDFVFVDGSHHYSDVRQDFNDWSPKIKTGGFLFMHDSRMNRGGAPFHAGSSEFTDQIIANNQGFKLVGEAFSLTCFEKL